MLTRAPQTRRKPLLSVIEPPLSGLADGLVHADRTLAAACALLPHLLPVTRSALLGDDVVARVRGMIAAMASELAQALADAHDVLPPLATTRAIAVDLAEALTASSAFLAHCHALALEWRLAWDLAERLGIDPARSPLLDELASGPDGDVARVARALIAAQARHDEGMRRMAVPLVDLPGDLHHIAMLALRAAAGEEVGANAVARVAEHRLRAPHDESRGRLGLISAMLGALGERAPMALALDRAGLALFLTAVGFASGQPRETIALATAEGVGLRLALAMRASGFEPCAIVETLAMVQPDFVLPAGIADVTPSRAVAILSEGTARFA